MRKVVYILLAAVMILLCMGVVMVFSTSAVLAEAKEFDRTHFLKRQGIAVCISIVAALIASRVNYHLLRDLRWFLIAPTLGMLVLVLIPGVGASRLGARRWLDLGPMDFQPSELGKLAVVVLLAWWLSHIKHQTNRLWKGVLLPLGLCAIPIGLIFVEPDFGTTLLLGCVCFGMLFLAGARIEYLAVTGTAGLFAFAFAVMQDAERMRRLIAFLNPEKYADGEAFQLINAIRAFINGGPTGQGLGESLQKHLYLPEAHSDFIFAIIGEELGPAGSFLVLVLFAVILVCGLMISARAADRFGKYLAFGLTLVIVLQALINLGVVTGCLPTKGIALPFISNGGSHLLMGLSMIGVLINIALRSEDEPEHVAESGKWD